MIVLTIECLSPLTAGEFADWITVVSSGNMAMPLSFSVLLSILIILIAGFIFIIRLTLNAQSIIRQQIRKLERCNRRYQSLFNECSDAVVIHCKNRIIDCNIQAAKLFGYSRSEFLCLNYEDLLPADEQVKDMTAETLQSFSPDGTFSYVSRIRRKDSTILDVILSSHIIDEKNDIIQTLITDITLQRDLVRAHQKSEEHQALILQSINEAVVTTDAMGIVERCNIVFSQMLALPQGKILNKHVASVLRLTRDLHAAESENALVRMTHVVLNEGATFRSNFHYYLKSCDGKEYVVQPSASPVRSRSGKVIGMVLILYDITEKIQLQEELLHSQKLESLGRIAGQIAHDFKNWLTVILGISENLLHSNLPEQVKHDVEKIHTAAQASAAMTRQLLSFARREPIQSQPTDIHRVLDNSIMMIDWSNNGTIEVIRQYKASQSYVKGDPNALANAFLNLGINAMEAMQQRGGMLQVSTENLELDSEFCKRQK
ncbi:MAG: PAS domain S-box protein, partial [Lentisphaerae bacterium]